LYTRSATGAHNHQLVGASDQGARSNGIETWSHAVGRLLGSIHHSPPDLNLILILVLNLILIFSTIFITDQYIKRLRHNSQLRTMRLNNYHAPFHSEKDSHLILEPSVSKNYRLSLKPMPAMCSLNTLGGKPFVNGSASICLVLMYSRLMV
jgi:hypothetical protein